LARIVDLDWQCRCVGPMAGAAEALAARIDAERLRGRVALTGPRTGAALDREYAAADVLVLASRTETYGMVVPEALARGLPVIATDVGGVPEALGRTADGTRPGLLVPPDNPDALATALRRWLTDPELRRDLRRAAAQRRAGLPTWDATTAAAARVLAEVAA
jgi:glycosyltransferase involved in cell wall biosynthesis